MDALRMLRGGRAALLAALGMAVLMTAAGCEEATLEKPPPRDESLLKLERAYTRQRLDAGGKASYGFHAEKRGAYLIVVKDNPEPLRITLKHPERTCYFIGNGSCELVSGPDETYDFEVISDSGEPVAFSVMVTHSEGKGLYEGQVGRPVPLSPNARHSGEVGVRESSYYTFTTGSGGVHTISLGGGQSDLVWRLFDAPDYDVILQECDYQPAAGDEVCRTIPLHAGARYYVKVEEQSGVPGRYHLLVNTP